MEVVYAKARYIQAKVDAAIYKAEVDKRVIEHITLSCMEFEDFIREIDGKSLSSYCYGRPFGIGSSVRYKGVVILENYVKRPSQTITFGWRF